MIRGIVARWLHDRREDHRRRILSALAHGEASGATIGRRSGLWSGTLYPALHELERDGVLVSRWEERRQGGSGEPRARLYRAAKPDCGPWG